MADPTPNRLFFALSPPSAVRRQIEKTARRLSEVNGLRGRQIDPSRYHITLRFLGDQVPAEVQAAATVEAPPFDLRLDRVGSFRSSKIPVWLGPVEVPAELAYLEQTLREALAHLPAQRPQRFEPHLTILRDAAGPVGPMAVEPIEWPVTEFVLIRSVLHERPARYETLASFPLRAVALPLQPRQDNLSAGK